MTDFEILVADMRKAQKDYFRTRSQNALRSAKKLEKQVDKHLEIAQQADEHLFDMMAMTLSDLEIERI